MVYLSRCSYHSHIGANIFLMHRSDYVMSLKYFPVAIHWFVSGENVNNEGSRSLPKQTYWTHEFVPTQMAVFFWTGWMKWSPDTNEWMGTGKFLRDRTYFPLYFTILLFYQCIVFLVMFESKIRCFQYLDNVKYIHQNKNMNYNVYNHILTLVKCAWSNVYLVTLTPSVL